MARDILDQEVIGITWRRRQHNDNRHNIVLEQTSSRRVERAVAGKKLGEGQNTFTTQFLDDYSTIVSFINITLSVEEWGTYSDPAKRSQKEHCQMLTTPQTQT